MEYQLKEQQYVEAIRLRRQKKTDAFEKIYRENELLKQKEQEQSAEIEKLNNMIDDLENRLEEYEENIFIENWNKKKVGDFYDIISSLPGF